MKKIVSEVIALWQNVYQSPGYTRSVKHYTYKANQVIGHFNTIFINMAKLLAEVVKEEEKRKIRKCSRKKMQSCRSWCSSYLGLEYFSNEFWKHFKDQLILSGTIMRFSIDPSLIYIILGYLIFKFVSLKAITISRKPMVYSEWYLCFKTFLF